MEHTRLTAITPYTRNEIRNSGRKFADEYGNVITLYELLMEYESASVDIYLSSGAVNFWEYLDNCTDKNGALTEL